MSARFRVDMLHPGTELRLGGPAQSWAEWFIGPDGTRRLVLFSLICVAVVVLMLVAILPPYWRLSSDLNAVPGLQRDVAARESDLALLRSNLGALSEEARRQIRWADLLAVLSEQVPATVKLQVVDAVRGAPPRPGAPQSTTPGRVETVLRIDAVTPLRPGSTPLLEVAKFMAGIMRDPTVNKRFALTSWEIKPGSEPGPAGGGQLLSVSIVLGERPQ